MLKSTDILMLIDKEIQLIETNFTNDPPPSAVDVLKDLKTEILYQESKLVDEMAKVLSISEMIKKEEKKYAYGKDILSNLKRNDNITRASEGISDKDFVCPLCDGTHGNNAKCQI